jgi:hypothetical protein
MKLLPEPETARNPEEKRKVVPFSLFRGDSPATAAAMNLVLDC